MRFIHACATLFLVTARFSDRDHLVSLLSEVDSKPNTDRLENLLSLSDLGSFIEERQTLRKGSRPEPARRRSDSPCNCADNYDDGKTTACLMLRLEGFYGQYNQVLAVDASGNSVESGRLALRQGFQDSKNSWNILSTLTSQLTTNISSTSIGLQAVVDRAVQRTFNEETLLVQSINSAWMNLITMTGKTDSGINSANDLLDATTTNITKWFNDLQNTEELVSYMNLQQVVTLANADLKMYTSQMNAVESSVYTVLNALENDMGGAEGNSSSLADSLEGTVDKLTGDVESFNSNIPYAGQDAMNRISVSLAGQGQSYQLAAQSATSGYTSGSKSKQDNLEKSTESQISDQSNSGTTLLTNTRNNLMGTVGTISDKQTGFKAISSGIFNSAVTAVQEISTSNQKNITTSVATMQSTLNAADTATSNIDSLLTGWNNDENQAVVNSNSNEAGDAQAATNTFNKLLSGIMSKQSSSLTSAQSAAVAAVSAVGTNFQSSMQQIGSQYDAVLSQMAQDSNNAAKASSSTTNGLTNTATSSSNAVDAVSQSMIQNVQSAFTNVLNSVSILPGGISETAGSTLDMYAVIQAAKTNRTQASEMIKAALFGSSTYSMDQQSTTEQAIDQLLSQIDSAAPSVSKSIGSITESLQGASGTGSSVQVSANGAGQKASDVVASASNDVANAMDSFGSSLNSMFKSLISAAVPGSGTVVGGAPSAANDAGNTVVTVQHQVDQANNNQEQAYRAGEDKVDEAASKIDSASETADTVGASSSDDIDSHVDNASGNVDDVAAKNSGDVADETKTQQDEIEAAQQRAELKISQLSVGDMDQLRALAASANSLMHQINLFLTSNNPTLFNSAMALPGYYNDIYHQLAHLADQVAGIESSFNSGGSMSYTSLINSISSKIRSLNSTQFGTLNQIGSDFNVSADRVFSNTSDFINQMVHEFVSDTQALQSQLAGMSDQVQAAELSLLNTPDGQNVVESIGNISQSMYELHTQMSEILQGVDSQGVGSAPPNMSSIFDLVANYTALAGLDAANASAVINKLSVAASGNINDAIQFSNSKKVSQDAIDREASLAALNENIANSQLAARRAALAQLQADSSQLASAYADQVEDQTNAQMNTASAVYNSVVKARADTASAMARIQQAFASQSSNVENAIDGQQSQSSTDIANLQNQMTLLLSLFNQYIQTIHGTFALADSDRQSFTNAVLVDVGNKLSVTDNDLIQMDSDMTEKIGDVSDAIGSIQNSKVESTAASLLNGFQAWLETQISLIQQDSTDLENISMSADTTSMQSNLNDAVAAVAANAKDLLTKSGLSTSAIDDILRNYR
jgi:hypothetical protein